MNIDTNMDNNTDMDKDIDVDIDVAIFPAYPRCVVNSCHPLMSFNTCLTLNLA